MTTYGTGDKSSNSPVSNWLVPKTLHRSFKLETNNIQRTAVFGISHCLHIYQFSRIIAEKNFNCFGKAGNYTLG